MSFMQLWRAPLLAVFLLCVVLSARATILAVADNGGGSAAVTATVESTHSTECLNMRTPWLLCDNFEKDKQHMYAEPRGREQERRAGSCAPLVARVCDDRALHAARGHAKGAGIANSYGLFSRLRSDDEKDRVAVTKV